MTDTRRPVLGAIAVVVKDDHVLLARRRKAPDAGLWGYPGGHVEFGETALAAAGRELHEETGVVADPEAYLTNVDVILPETDSGPAVHYLLAAVRCRYVSGTPEGNDDVFEAAWIHIDQVLARALPMSEQVDRLLVLALGLSNEARASASDT
ncbi:MAG: NUDIX hydrolase [Pseudomonadota bacterium]